MASYDKDKHLYVKCGRPSLKRNFLSLVGVPKGRRKEGCKKNLVEQSKRLTPEKLTRIFMNNKATLEPIYIYSSCKTYVNYLHVPLHEKKKSEACQGFHQGRKDG